MPRRSKYSDELVTLRLVRSDLHTVKVALKVARNLAQMRGDPMLASLYSRALARVENPISDELISQARACGLSVAQAVEALED